MILIETKLNIELIFLQFTIKLREMNKNVLKARLEVYVQIKISLKYF